MEVIFDGCESVVVRAKHFDEDSLPCPLLVLGSGLPSGLSRSELERLPGNPSLPQILIGAQLLDSPKRSSGRCEADSKGL